MVSFWGIWSQKLTEFATISRSMSATINWGTWPWDPWFVSSWIVFGGKDGATSNDFINFLNKVLSVLVLQLYHALELLRRVLFAIWLLRYRLCRSGLRLSGVVSWIQRLSLLDTLVSTSRLSFSISCALLRCDLFSLTSSRSDRSMTLLGWNSSSSCIFLVFLLHFLHLLFQLILTCSKLGY
jgi:hypothetical protein